MRCIMAYLVDPRRYREKPHNLMLRINKNQFWSRWATGIIRRFTVALVLFFAMAHASGQATSSSLEISTLTEVEIRATKGGRFVVKLQRANRVVPGDPVLCTVRIYNRGSAPVLAPSIVEAVPDHMTYVAGSASGPGATITFSVDGQVFGPPEKLRSRGSDGKMRIAKAAEYTHIRWQLKNDLKPESVAFARFRAVVK